MSRVTLLLVLVVAGCHEPSSVPDGGASDLGGIPQPDVRIISEGLSGSEHEPVVVAAPDGRIAAAWVKKGAARFEVTYAISSDDGDSFPAPQAMPLPANDDTCSNTSLTADTVGNLYIAYACERHSTANQRTDLHILVAKSPVGTTAFEAPVEVADPALTPPFYDQPRVIALADGALLVSYSQGVVDGASFDASLMAARSDDGQSWTRSAVAAAPPGGFQNFGRLCMAGERLWVAYFDATEGFVLARSDDGGRTWPANYHAIVQAADEGEISPTVLDCVAAGDEVWVLYALGAAEDPQRVPSLDGIRVAHSIDAGRSIASRATVQDAEAGSVFMQPAITRDQDGGLDLIYYAGSATGDTTAALRRSRSMDGGAHFSPSAVLKSPVVLESSRTSDRWIGDYVGLASAGGELFVGFTDNSAPAAHIGFIRTTP